MCLIPAHIHEPGYQEILTYGGNFYPSDILYFPFHLEFGTRTLLLQYPPEIILPYVSFIHSLSQHKNTHFPLPFTKITPNLRLK